MLLKLYFLSMIEYFLFSSDFNLSTGRFKIITGIAINKQEELVN